MMTIMIIIGMNEKDKNVVSINELFFVNNEP